ncbi:hypothetical protein ACJRO7_024242 [Eucalyptus globulus]|uniref:Uncharacterized protein n=1 Tax=Eucalyptus globulus TaxID=34317 RepID=A0ABD3K817_EUCGL
MAREKIKIEKIDNLMARQVTFSKRRRGLIKKAQKLAVLNDADVSIIIFSATGKLHEFSNFSMEDTLTRYVLHFNDSEKPVQPCLALQRSNLEMLHKEVNDKMRGEDLEGVGVEELGQLENKLGAGLSLVLKTEEERVSTEINKLQRKENKQLRQKMKTMMILHQEKLVTMNSEGDDAVLEAEGMLLESVNGQQHICRQ